MHVAKSLHKNGPIFNRPVSVRDCAIRIAMLCHSFTRDRGLALYLTAYLDPTLKYLAPPKIAVSALLARRRWGTPVVLFPRSTEDHSLCLFRCALLTTLRPDNVLPSLLGRVFSLHALSITSNLFDQQRSHMNVLPNSKWKCTWKCTWEHACALWCFSNKSKIAVPLFPHSNCMHSDTSLDHVVS